MSQSDEVMLTVKQVARRLSVDEKTVSYCLLKGEHRAVNVGGIRPEYRIRPGVLENFIESRSTGKQAE